MSEDPKDPNEPIEVHLVFSNDGKKKTIKVKLSSTLKEVRSEEPTVEGYAFLRKNKTPI